MLARSKVVYLATSGVEPDWEDEFNRWYDEEHVPILAALPGYLSARRFVAVDGEPTYMAMYEIADRAAQRSEAHDRATHTPWRARVLPHVTMQLAFYEQLFPAEGVLGADTGELGGLLVNRQDVDPAQESEYNAWYNEEHLPALARVAGVLGARRFRAIEGGPRYMALYYLADPAVQSSDAWRQAVDTPWTARMRAAMRHRWRVVYRPL